MCCVQGPAALLGNFSTVPQMKGWRMKRGDTFRSLGLKIESDRVAAGPPRWPLSTRRRECRMNEAVIRQTLAPNPIKQLLHSGVAAGKTRLKWENEMVQIKRANGIYFCYLLIPKQRTIFCSRSLIHRRRRLGLGKVYWIQGCTVQLAVNSDSSLTRTMCSWQQDVTLEFRRRLKTQQEFGYSRFIE